MNCHSLTKCASNRSTDLFQYIWDLIVLFGVLHYFINFTYRYLISNCKIAVTLYPQWLFICLTNFVLTAILKSWNTAQEIILLLISCRLNYGNSNSITNQRFIQVMDVHICCYCHGNHIYRLLIQNSKILKNLSDYSLPYPDFSSCNTKPSTEQSKFQSIHE